MKKAKRSGFTGTLVPTKKPKKEPVRTLYIEAPVPQSVIDEASRVAQNIIASYREATPIKRVQKISNAQLDKMKKDGKAAIAILNKIESTLCKEHERLVDQTEADLTLADQKWVDKQIGRLFKLGDDLALDFAI